MPGTSDEAEFVRPTETFGVASTIRMAGASPAQAPSLLPPDTFAEPLTAALRELALFTVAVPDCFAEQCGVAANAIDQGVVDTQAADAVPEEA